MIAYQSSPKVLPGKVDNRLTLSTPQGGQIVVDSKLLSLWREASGSDLDQVLNTYLVRDIDPEHVKAGLVCLAESGLLIRSKDRTAVRTSNSIDDGLVSVVIVNFNSLDWLMECLPSLSAQTYPSLEIIIVDNASDDDSLKWLQNNYPQVKVISQNQVSSFACALNRGIELAEGKYFLILNPDVRLHPDAVTEMVATAIEGPSCAAVAAKLKFMWAPGFVNGIGNKVGAASWGTDNALGHLDLGQFDTWREIPSACFAAALIPRTAWETVGPTDEGFPLYYEDSEWSYRARLLGHTIRAAPLATVYHAFGSRNYTGTDVQIDPAKLRKVIYGRLRFAAKLIPSFFTIVRFIVSYSLEDFARLIYSILRWDRSTMGAVLGGWSDFIDQLANIRVEREKLLLRQPNLDTSLFVLQQAIPPPYIWRGLPELTWDLVHHHYLPLIKSGKTRQMPEFSADSTRIKLLIVSHDIVDAKLAGTGMRYLELARSLNTSLDVTLAVPNETTLEIPGVHLETYRLEQAGSLRPLVESCDVVLISSFILQKFPYIKDSKARKVIDLYDPIILENLHYYQAEPLVIQESLNEQTVDLMNQLVDLGDYFICANERQRDFWIGVLAANGRVNPRVFADDTNLRSLIDVVGMGIPERSPIHKPMLRGVRPGFPPDARIVLWGGGIWDWLDPLSLVRSWPSVLANHPSCRLVFLGTRHPNPLVPHHKMVDRVIGIAEEIGEKDKTIFFFEWISYEEREALLSEADVGVALHPLHVETRYSIRTRVLDYIWAKLPILVSDGDVTSEWVREHQLGKVVPPNNASEVANALNEMLSHSKEIWSPNFESIQAELVWSWVVEPLREYCQHGKPAQDKKGRSKQLGDPKRGLTSRELFARAWYISRAEGFMGLAHRLRRYLQWRLS